MSLNLGAITKLLRKQPQDNVIHFNFGWFVPGDFTSYRGYYEDLAITFKAASNGETPKVKDFLAACLEANGKVFEGYKGGRYRMRADTDVYVSNWGECSGTTITGVCDAGYGVTVLMTGHEDAS